MVKESNIQHVQSQVKGVLVGNRGVPVTLSVTVTNVVLRQVVPMSWRTDWQETWRGRAQRIYAQVVDSNSPPSVRQIAAATGLSTSSVNRRQQAMAARQVYPASALWELESAHQWLR